MTKYALVNDVEHQDLRVITDRSPALGDNMMYAMTFCFEIRSVQGTYPILFHEEEGELHPVALFGFEDGENLFLDDHGWHASYIPAMIRRQPFLIGFQNTESNEKRRMLSVDMDHPRLSRELGEPLFEPLGGRTAYLEQTADLLEAIYEGHMHNREFVSALQQHDLIESVTMEIELKDKSRNQLFGFSAIHEERVQQLPGDTLAEFSARGFLLPLFMILASTVNLQTLVDRKNERLHQ